MEGVYFSETVIPICKSHGITTQKTNFDTTNLRNSLTAKHQMSQHRETDKKNITLCRPNLFLR